MFLPTAFAQLVVETPAVIQGVQYSEWADATLKSPRHRDLGGNAWLGKVSRSSKEVMSRPQACFDAEFYVMVRFSLLLPLCNASPWNMQNCNISSSAESHIP